MGPSHSAEVYTAEELARAIGLPAARVQALVASGELPSVSGRFISHREALRWGHKLRNPSVRGFSGTAVPDSLRGNWSTVLTLFEAKPAAPRQPGMPAAVSIAAHLLAGGAAVLLTTAGLDSAGALSTELRVSEPARLVYLALPGPGGGGGGGGTRQRTPPPEARKRGDRKASSPVPALQPPPPTEPPPATPPERPTEPIVAPVVPSPANPVERPGTLESTTASAESGGPGEGNGVGDGSGTGVGSGTGPGIGPGSGGGTGGGPYRAGSGVTPPRLLREVKPVYTEEARRRGTTGEVVLEIVVKSDGTVGDIRVLDGLGAGLDERAVQAVRGWRFAPGQRLGHAVDVLVEVAVTFRFR
ncbi:MAG: energy transducer TonB [Vicinamibacterales bacterium]